MAKCKVSLSTVPCVNVNSTVYDFESIELGINFAKNCSSPDSVNVVLDLIDDAGEVLQRLYDYDCKTEESNIYPIVESAPVVEPVVVEDVSAGSTSESEGEASEPVAVMTEQAQDVVLEEPVA